MKKPTLLLSILLLVGATSCQEILETIKEIDKPDLQKKPLVIGHRRLPVFCLSIRWKRTSWPLIRELTTLNPIWF